MRNRIKSSDQLQDANDFLKHLQQELTDLKNTINLRNDSQLDDKLNTLIELQQTLISASEDNNKVNIKKRKLNTVSIIFLIKIQTYSHLVTKNFKIYSKQPIKCISHQCKKLYRTRRCKCKPIKPSH